ncbi:low-affinity methionine permease [Rhizina undulata]
MASPTYEPEAQPLISYEERASIHLPSSPASSSAFLLVNGTESLSISNPSEPKHQNNTTLEDVTTGRNLGWTSAVMLIFSRMIGSGVFATPGTILLTAGSPGMSLVLWVVGAMISFCGLAVYLEFGTMLPKSGGEKVYLEFAFQRPRFLTSTVFAVNAILLGFTASNCIIFGQYLLYALGAEPTEWSQRALAAGAIIAVTLIHGLSIKTGIWIQNFLGFVKIFLMIFMVFIGFVVLVTGKSLAGPSQIDLPNFFAGSESNWSLLAIALHKVLYAFAGYGNVNNVMGEVRNPVKTLKSAAPAALIIVTAIYLLINLAYFSVVPLEEIKTSGQLVAALFFTRTLGDTAGRIFLPGLIAISAIGNVFVVVYSQSRVNQEIARQGFVPFASVLASNKPFNAPLGGLILHLIPSLLVIVLPPPGDAYAFILDVVGYPVQFFSIAIAIGLLLLRTRRPNLNRPFKAWTISVYVKILASLALLCAPFMNDKDGKGDVGFWYGTYAVVGTAIILIAIIYWYIWTIAWPRWKGYTLEEEERVLDDGTTITQLVKIYH